MWHGKSEYTYIIYDDEGLYVFEGSRKQVAMYLGVSESYVFNAVKHNKRIKRKYTVEQIRESELEE